VTRDRDDGSDRDAILARRALLISSALAAFACEPAQTADAVAPVVTVPAPSATPPPPPRDPPPTLAPRPALESWVDLASRAPPREVPAGLDPIDEESLRSQAEAVAPLYATLETLWNHAPLDCVPSEARCVDEWERYEEQLTALARSHHGLRPLGASGRGARTTTVQRDRAHASFLDEAVRALRSSIDEESGGWPSTAREQLTAIEHRNVLFMPCLSCAAPPQPDFAGVAVTFAEDSSRLDDVSMVEMLVDVLSRHPHLRVEVRGHAAPGERDAPAIADARARAVIDALVGAGVGSQRMVRRSFGDALPVSGATPDAARRFNRRVDIEILP
jgi:outer membrane protein OmpA-like peptidoglycan-associated protein